MKFKVRGFYGIFSIIPLKSRTVPPDHLLLDSAPNIGPLVYR
jgi:hypothetical protein